MINKILVTIIFTLLMLVSTSGVLAATSYGTGYYTNLCGGGTTANVYTCDAGCNPALGVCQSNNSGVVKWVCNGKWNQCLESESDWTNRGELGAEACNKTVQMSLFDKQCRREDGSWDPTCRLLGYMVWYSGECNGGVTNPTPTVTRITPTPTVILKPTVTPKPTITSKMSTPVPTLKPTMTPRPTATPRPTVTPRPTRTPTPAPVVTVCNKKCSTDATCGAGFSCMGGECRNPACPADGTCFCGNVVATSAGKTPATGGESILLIAGVGLALGGGIYARRMAAKIW